MYRITFPQYNISNMMILPRHIHMYKVFVSSCCSSSGVGIKCIVQLEEGSFLCGAQQSDLQVLKDGFSCCIFTGEGA